MTGEQSAGRFRDAELLDALRHARGDDRTLLVIGLGDADGDQGPAALRELYASEKGHVRSAALASLARRTGADCTDVCLDALHAPSAMLQQQAAQLLADYGSAAAAVEVFGWLRKRLRRKNRSHSWDPTEVPSAIRFAVRHGLHRDVAAVILESWDRLEVDERAWLARTWPALVDHAGRPADPDTVAPPGPVPFEVYEDERTPAELSASEAYSEHIEAALERARKSAARSGSTPRTARRAR